MLCVGATCTVHGTRRVQVVDFTSLVWHRWLWEVDAYSGEVEKRRMGNRQSEMCRWVADCSNCVDIGVVQSSVHSATTSAGALTANFVQGN